MTNEMKLRKQAIEAEMDDGDRTNFDEWEELCAIEQEECRERELPEITKYFEEHIKGKKWEDINPDTWDFYSDWHKDVFGFRPRQTRELGVRY